MRIVTRPESVAGALAVAVLGLVLAGVVVGVLQSWGYEDTSGALRLFDLNREDNIPTWYSSAALLLCAVLLAVIAAGKRAGREPYAAHWAALSLIFLFLSVDETAQVHEWVSYFVTNSPLRPSGLFHYAWVIPFGVLVLLFVAAYARFLFHLPARTRWLFVAAGALYVGGALGLEMVAGFYRGLADRRESVRTALWVAEEFCEMAGVVVFAYALMTYLRSYARGVRVTFGDEE